MKTALAAAEPPRRVFRSCTTAVTYTAPMVALISSVPIPTTTVPSGTTTVRWM